MRRVILTLFCIMLLTAVACGEPYQNDLREQDQTATEPATVPETPPAQEPSAAIQEETVSGELGNVNLDAKTFSVKADDAEHTFAFSDETEVVGAAGTQGLAAREGSRVMVTYRADGDAKTATRIEIQ